MTKKVYDEESIFLQGWEDKEGKQIPIKIHPLTIKKFRKLAEILNTQQREAEDEVPVEERTEFLDVLINAVAFCMETFEPKLSDPDKVSDYVDYPTITYILEVAGGVKLGDPNLQAAMAAGMN